MGGGKFTEFINEWRGPGQIIDRVAVRRTIRPLARTFIAELRWRFERRALVGLPLPLDESSGQGQNLLL